MHRVFRVVPVCVGIAVACGIAAAVGTNTPVGAEPDASRPAYYDESVKPILEANCYRCHGGANHRGGYNMNTRESLLKGSKHGLAVTPGHPETSMMIKLVRHEGPADDPMNMPPAPKPKISDADIATLEKWIKAGAVTSADPLFSAPAQ